MIGIIFVHVCAEGRRVVSFKQQRCFSQLWQLANARNTAYKNYWRLDKHTHPQKGREPISESRLVPACRLSSSLELSGNIIITQKPQHPSLSNLTFQHIYQHMPRMNTDAFSSQPPSFISPAPFHLSRWFFKCAHFQTDAFHLWTHN